MLKIRRAHKEDSPILLSLIKELAEYEKLADAVVATVSDLEESIFGGDPGSPEVYIGEYEGVAVAFTLTFYNYSTFLGKKGIYLEDLYVKPEMRGKGFGKKMLLNIFKLAKEKDCGRVEWSVLDWNEPAIQFYKSLGAMPMEEWTVFRMTEGALAAHGSQTVRSVEICNNQAINNTDA